MQVVNGESVHVDQQKVEKHVGEVVVCTGFCEMYLSYSAHCLTLGVGGGGFPMLGTVPPQTTHV